METIRRNHKHGTGSSAWNGEIVLRDAADAWRRDPTVQKASLGRE
jgi:hypothetical protein